MSTRFLGQSGEVRAWLKSDQRQSGNTSNRRVEDSSPPTVTNQSRDKNIIDFHPKHKYRPRD
ncbi:MAG TPA: hypothetical protein VIK24_19980 [Pyrinomonadaceae bacterium]